jgi:hypothetical protein
MEMTKLCGYIKRSIHCSCQQLSPLTITTSSHDGVSGNVQKDTQHEHRRMYGGHYYKGWAERKRRMGSVRGLGWDTIEMNNERAGAETRTGDPRSVLGRLQFFPFRPGFLCLLWLLRGLAGQYLAAQLGLATEGGTEGGIFDAELIDEGSAFFPATVCLVGRCEGCVEQLRTRLEGLDTSGMKR